MRKIILLLFLFLLSCNKESNTAKGKLKNKSLAAIRSKIQGRWQLHYTYGGITGHIRQDFINSFMEFKPNDSISWILDNTLWINDKINWINTTDIFHESTYIISCEDFRTYPYTWIVDGIYNDTLILISNGSEPDKYHLTKK